MSERSPSHPFVAPALPHAYRICLSIILCICWSSTRADVTTAPTPKSPVPDQRAQQRAAKLVRYLYGDEIAKAKTAEQKAALAIKLLEIGREENEDEASRFAAFVTARDLAAVAGDLQTACATIDAMNTSFVIDALAQKADVAMTSSNVLHAVDDRRAFISQIIRLVDQDLSADRYDVGRRMADLAISIARSSHNSELAHQATDTLQRVRESELLFLDAKSAKSILMAKPDDPEANLKIGRYLCLVKRSWLQGLPFLFRGHDADLRKLARLDMDGANTSTARLALADAWWNYSDAQPGRTGAGWRQRALYWYELARQGLTGLARAKVEKRLNSFPHEVPTAAMATTDVPEQDRQPPKEENAIATKPVTEDVPGPAVSSPPLTPSTNASEPSSSMPTTFLNPKDIVGIWTETSGGRFVLDSGGRFIYAEDQPGTWKLTGDALILTWDAGRVDTYNKHEGDAVSGVSTIGHRVIIRKLTK